MNTNEQIMKNQDQFYAMRALMQTFVQDLPLNALKIGIETEETGETMRAIYMSELKRRKDEIQSIISELENEQQS